ncbi:MAG: MetQ/NlpA family ABC transporter substrate-binding protein [Clostridia bacterium]|nr:MetQ/NlpA family ABC transporter substrate-binding protein [Clostridia bacterium]
MKKLLAILLVTALLCTALAGCGSSGNESAEAGKLVVGATPAPHAEILEVAKEILAEQGIELEIKEFQDYVLPNTAVDTGEIDANFFQHKPYLDDFNAENGTEVVSVAKIHYEPFGIYAGKTASLDKLANGAKVAVPNDSTNEGRALQLLQQEGLIKLTENAGLSARPLDIAENPLNLEIVELDAAMVPKALQDVDIAVVNGNYAIESGLKVSDALAVEAADSLAAETYANILCVKAGNEENKLVKALIEALQSDKVKEFIEKKYEGAVVPVF